MSFTMKEEEYYELQEYVYEYIYDELSEDALQFASSKFYDDLCKSIIEIYLESWKVMENMSDDEYEIIYNIIYEIVYSFFDIYSYKFPHRSLSSYINKPNFESIESQLECLRNIPQPKQRTEEWYEFRHQHLTASNMWKLFSTDSNINSFIYEKCCPRESNFSKPMGNSVKWGNLFEPVSIEIYEIVNSTTVEDFGCITHPEIDYIAASPDGINVDKDSPLYGRMLEVKNIYNREITGIPKVEYWIQMQLQMEVCGLDICDFLETRFKEYDDETTFYNDNDNKWKGVILHFKKIDSSYEYRYMPLEYKTCNDNISKWINDTRKNMSLEGYQIMDITYWYLDELSCVVVKRNKEWFKCAKDIINKYWDIIQKEKIEGYEHRAPKKKSPDTKLHIYVESDTHTIHNLNIEPKINLIKLDS